MPKNTYESPGDVYITHNQQDWPARICGTLSLRDIFEVSKGVPELGIPEDARLEDYRY